MTTAIAGTLRRERDEYDPYHERYISLLYEWASVRAASLTLVQSFDPDAMLRVGMASGLKFSVRSLVWMIAGHEFHHRQASESGTGWTKLRKAAIQVKGGDADSADSTDTAGSLLPH